MPSVQRFLSGHDSLARAAQVSASSVRPASAIERVQARRAGGGQLRLAGWYTGHEAAQVEVEIAPASAGGSRRASAVQFAGVGNGQLAVQAVDAAAPLQTLTLTLADLGVPTEHARLDLREVQLRARAGGAAGNQIRLTVQPNLQRAATPWALLENWPASQQTQSGAQWDFGGRPLSGGGMLAEDSPRLQFGLDPQVYRPWREYKNGAWRHGLSPALERDVPKGAAVWQVTGGYVVTVSDGAQTEVFGDAAAGQPEIVTLHDLLQALQASALLEVAGVVAADRAPGGQAAIDLPLRTSAWLLSAEGKVRLQDVTVPAGAPTQTLTLRCVNADKVGAERWAVQGDVSGPMPPAVTGQPYAHGAIGFLIPALAAAAQPAGEWAFKFEPASRGQDEGVPSVCVRPFRFGRNARARKVTFRYQRRPPPECKCSDMSTPRLPLACLGIDGEDDMALDAAHQTRLQTLYAWRSELAQSNTVPQGPVWVQADLDLIDEVTGIFARALGETYGASAAAAEWDAALAQMRAELDWLRGQTSPGAAGTGNERLTQGGRVGDVYRNEELGRKYRIEAVRREGVAVPWGPTFSASDTGWTDPYAAAWRDDDTPFTLSVADAAGVNWAFDYVQGEVLPGAPGVARDVQRTGDELRQALAHFPRRYTARMDHVRTLAGIVPKSESSSSAAGSCWTDHGDTHWWVDVEGYYLPAFTNRAYVSARRDADTGRPYSTQEFGFGLVVACPDRLREGDQLMLDIQQVDGERPYQVGDEAQLRTVAAGPAWLAGGVDGTDEQRWRVTGSASGALPDYVLPTAGAPAPAWAAAGVQLQMALGGIAFALGDAFSLAVEAGQWRWRKDGGAWSALQDIPASGQAALADGLALHFEPGAAPSFAPGDAYVFAVHQPWAASHVRDANAAAWAWEGDAATLTLDMGAVRPLGAVALARYALPAGAAVEVALSDDGLLWGAPQPLDVRQPVCVHFWPAQARARFVRLSLSHAPGGSIGWLWAGEPMACDHHASACQRRRQWAAQRGEGVNPASLYAGAGDGWTLAWTPGDGASSRLLQADVERLLALLDWAQRTDEPLIFVPHHLHPQDAALVRFAEDALEISDAHEYQSDDARRRLLSAQLSLSPMFA